MYSLIRQLNRKDGGGESDAGAAATWPAWRWSRPAEWRWWRWCPPRTGRSWGGASWSDWCSRRRSAGGRSGASGPTGSWRCGASACWSGSRVVAGRGPGGPARPRTARRPDAGGDGGSPRGAPPGRGGHGSSGTLAGRSSDDAIRSDDGDDGACSSGWRRRRPARWRRRSTRPCGARRRAGAGPDRHRPPPRQLARDRDPAGRHRRSCRAGIPPVHLGGLAHRLLAHQAPGLHAARGDARGAGLRAERALDRAGPGAGPAGQGVRRRDGGDGALHPAGGRPAERGPPRRGLRALPADAVLLHPGDEPARPAALGRHRHRQHRGDRGARGHGVHRDRGDRHADAGARRAT